LGPFFTDPDGREKNLQEELREGDEKRKMRIGAFDTAKLLKETIPEKMGMGLRPIRFGRKRKKRNLTGRKK